MSPWFLGAASAVLAGIGTLGIGHQMGYTRDLVRWAAWEPAAAVECAGIAWGAVLSSMLCSLAILALSLLPLQATWSLRYRICVLISTAVPGIVVLRSLGEFRDGCHCAQSGDAVGIWDMGLGWYAMVVSSALALAAAVLRAALPLRRRRALLNISELGFTRLGGIPSRSVVPQSRQVGSHTAVSVATRKLLPSRRATSSPLPTFTPTYTLAAPKPLTPVAARRLGRVAALSMTKTSTRQRQSPLPNSTMFRSSTPSFNGNFGGPDMPPPAQPPIPMHKGGPPPNGYIRLYPISLGDDGVGPVVYLGSHPTMDEVLTSRNRDVLAVPIPNAGKALVQRALLASPISALELIRIGPELVCRSGMLFDRLPWQWSRLDPAKTKSKWAGRFIGRFRAEAEKAPENLSDLVEVGRPVSTMDELRARTLSIHVHEVEMQIAGLEEELNEMKTGKRNGMPTLMYIRRLEVLTGLMQRRKEMLQEINEVRTLCGVDRHTGNLSHQGVGGYTSPFALLAEMLRREMRVVVDSVIIEDAWLLEDSVKLGGAVKLERLPSHHRQANLDLLEARGDGKEREMEIVDCLTDEAIGMALATGAPLYVEKACWAGMARRASGAELVFEEGQPHVRVKLPEVPEWEKDQMPSGGGGDGDGDGESDKAKAESERITRLVGQISSSSELRKIPNGEKVRCLLDAGVSPLVLPRPRTIREKGTDPLDQLLLPLVSAKVRLEFEMDKVVFEGKFEEYKRLKEMIERTSVTASSTPCDTDGVDPEEDTCGGDSAYPDLWN